MTVVSAVLLLSMAGILIYMRCDPVWSHATVGAMILQVRRVRVLFHALPGFLALSLTYTAASLDP